MRSFVLVLAAIALSGCCFGGEFAQGFALQGDCDSVISSVNSSMTRIDSMPDPLADVAEPTPEQVASSSEPMAQAYEQAATQLAAMSLTNTQVITQRDALVVLYRDAAATLRTQFGLMAQAMRVGDMAAIEAAGAAADSLGPREDAIINELNRVCGR